MGTGESIKDLRRLSNMTQQDFARFLGIPVGTLRNWEQGIANPPDYVVTMIINSIKRDKMINIETLQFIKAMDFLAKLSKSGIEEFGKATSKNIDDMVFYDEKNDNKVILQACVIDDEDCYHHDIAGYFENNEYSAKVKFGYEGEKYICVTLATSHKEIYIQDGEWDFDQIYL